MKLGVTLGTNYCYESYNLDLNRILTSCLNDGEEVDIAGVHFTPSAMGILTSALFRGLNVKDSQDDARNELLKANIAKREQNEIIQGMSTEELPTPTSAEGDDIIAYLKSLKEDVVYTIPVDMHVVLRNCLVILIQYYRPEIQIDATSFIKEVYLEVHDVLSRRSYTRVIETCPDKKWNVLLRTGILPITIETTDMHKKFEVYGVGMVSWDRLLSEYVVVPAYFGREKIAKNPELKEIWIPVIDQVLRDITKYFTVSNKSLIRFLKEEC